MHFNFQFALVIINQCLLWTHTDFVWYSVHHSITITNTSKGCYIVYLYLLIFAKLFWINLKSTQSSRTLIAYFISSSSLQWYSDSKYIQMHKLYHCEYVAPSNVHDGRYCYVAACYGAWAYIFARYPARVYLFMVHVAVVASWSVGFKTTCWPFF